MMKQFRLWTAIRSAGILLVFAASLALCGLSQKDKGANLQKTATNDQYRPFLINNVFNYYGNNGDGSYNKYSSDNEGFEFPKGTGKHVIFEDGVVWGGYHKGVSDPKVGGSVYKHALQAGPILTYGTATTDPVADDPTSSAYRVFRVRPDIGPSVTQASVEAKLQLEVDLIGRYESYSTSDLYTQYVTDWNEWPADLGAPYKDVDSNGVYDPSVDIPGQPGADQTLWYVANDMNATRVASLSGSLPIGLEMRRTIWGYKRAGALGNTIFMSTILINKSGAAIDSMFLVQWSDPDLGTASNDFAGCDSARSLGYIWDDGNDAVYGTAVPAGGFDFFQGPMVAGSSTDTAIFRLKYRPGHKNLPMSAFVFFINGSSVFTDPVQGTNGNIQWYRLMNGKIAPSGSDFINPLTNQATKFCLNGDPVSDPTGAVGWVDGTNGGAGSGDRRICMVTGPFTMAAGDTQELVVANLAGLGADRYSSITVMRNIDDKAQATYDMLFKVPSPPPAPEVTLTALDREVVLSWGDSAALAKTEGYYDMGFTFQGYKVYEFSDAAASNPVLLGTYDLADGITTIADTLYDATSGLNIPTVAVQGYDKGIIHQYDVTASQITGSSLVNGTKYYFGVTAYGYCADPPASAGTHGLEDSYTSLTVTPASASPGTRYNAKTGEAIAVTHSSGISSAVVTAEVINPGALAASDYEIRVIATDSVNNADLGAMVPNPRWKVYDKTNNAVVNGIHSDYSAFTSASPIANGMQVAVEGSPFYVYGSEYSSFTMSPSSLNLTGVNGVTLYAGENFLGYSLLTASEVTQDVQIIFTDSAKGRTGGQYAYDFIRTSSSGSGGAPYGGFFPQPFKVFELNLDGTHKRQLDFVFMEATTASTLDSIWAPGPDATDREYAFIIADTYSATEKTAKYNSTNLLKNSLALDSVIWSGWWTLTSSSKPAYNKGDTLTIKATRIVTTNDVWSFSTKTLAPTYSSDLAKGDVAKINVFPNPYFGFNAQETNKYGRFVTFNHLPKRAVIRIFNLAGVLVRTLQKETDSQFFTWDLQNESSFPVAAGMYVAYIDMPEIGATKTLKFAIIPEQQILDRW